MGRQAESSAVTNSIEVTLLHIHMWTVDRQNHLQNQNHNHLDMWAGKMINQNHNHLDMWAGKIINQNHNHFDIDFVF